MVVSSEQELHYTGADSTIKRNTEAGSGKGNSIFDFETRV